MKYYINTETEKGGKILGFVKLETGVNIEVKNSEYVKAQNFNTIVINGEDIIFSKIDYRDVKEVKQNQIEKIKQNCTANDPHTLLVTLANADEISITFNGGDSSASAIKSGIELVQANNPEATTIQLWDIDNILHTVSLSEALEISKKIGGKYLNDMYRRQNLIAQINSATTKEEIELIVW